jgi:hypothetical protein
VLRNYEYEADKWKPGEVKAIAKDIEFNSEKIKSPRQKADAIVKGICNIQEQAPGRKNQQISMLLCEEYLRLSYHGLRAKDNHSMQQ